MLSCLDNDGRIDECRADVRDDALMGVPTAETLTESGHGASSSSETPASPSGLSSSRSSVPIDLSNSATDRTLLRSATSRMSDRNERGVFDCSTCAASATCSLNEVVMAIYIYWQLFINLVCVSVCVCARTREF